MIIDFQSSEGRLLVAASGKASLNRGLELYKRLVDEAVARGINSIVLDGSAITGGLSTMEQYQLGKTIRGAGRKKSWSYRRGILGSGGGAKLAQSI
jgi:hypothetical protein